MTRIVKGCCWISNPVQCMGMGLLAGECGRFVEQGDVIGSDLESGVIREAGLSTDMSER